MAKIDLRRNVYSPRLYFECLLREDIQRAYTVCHRRAGKSYALIGTMIIRAIKKAVEGATAKQRPENMAGEWLRYHFVAPTEKGAVAIGWDYLLGMLRGLEPYGYKLTPYKSTNIVTLEAPKGLNGSEFFKIEFYFKGESMERGLYSDGMVIDEAAHFKNGNFSSQIAQPMLSDRKGWIIWSTTPKPVPEHYNHYAQCKADPNILVVELRPEDTSVLDEDILLEQKKKSPKIYEVEFMLNWLAADTEYTYARDLVIASQEGRICKVPVMGNAPVHTAWDIGVRDKTAIWFFQFDGKSINIVDYEEGTSQGVQYYVQLLRDKGYAYGVHLLPHDVTVREWGNGGVPRNTVLEENGIKVTILERTKSIAGGVSEVRGRLPAMWFDEEKTSEGRAALEQYRMAGATKADKDASHAADAMRTLCEGAEKGKYGTKAATHDDEPPMSDFERMAWGI